MKKIILLFLLMLPIGFLSSCTSDEDLPHVELTLTFEGLYESQGELYQILGEDLGVKTITIQSLSGKPSSLGEVTFLWNGWPIASTILAPYTFVYSTAELSPGTALLGLQMGIYEEGKTSFQGTLSYTINLINEDDLPEDAQPFVSDTITINGD